MNSLDWNDLRYVVAIARTGSAAGAARRLGVSHATVLRRIQQLEKGVGTPLFDRRQTGYVATAAGARFLDLGELFERELSGTRNEVAGECKDFAGVIRFTTTDSLSYYFMPDILASLRVRYPQIRVDLRVTNAAVDLDMREADVTLRPTSEPPPNWVGRSVHPVAWGLYASKAYLERRPWVDGVVHDWLLPEVPVTQDNIRLWLAKRIGSDPVVASANSYLMLGQMARFGMGVALLPDFIGKRAELEQLEQPLSDVVGGIWLLTHPNLRHVGRIRAFMEHVAEAMRETWD